MSQNKNPTFKPVQANALKVKVFTGIPDFANDPKYELVKIFVPCAAYTSIVIFMLLAVAAVGLGIKLHGNLGFDVVEYSCIGAFFFFYGIYSFLTIHYPDYLAGRPNPIKLWPIALVVIAVITGQTYLYLNNKLELYLIILFTVGGVVILVFQYVLHFGYDDTQSRWIKSKPWYYKLVEQPPA